MSLNENYMVQKSIPLLYELRNSKLNLQEFKLIEVYLSKINSHKPEQRTVTFTKADLQDLFGKQLDFSELKKNLDVLRHLQVSEIFADGELSIEKSIVLFEMSEISYTDDDIQEIKLTCSESAMHYFFNIEELRYLRYKLRNVAKLSSKYSYQLFLYLLENRFKDTWKVNVNDLIAVFNNPYDDYTRFNKLILKPCCKEINEKTNLKFEYTNIRRGLDRATKDIIFDIVSWGDLPNVLQDAGAGEEPKPKAIEPQQQTLDTDLQELTTTEKTSLYYLIKVKYPDFTDEQTNNKLKALYYYCLPKVKNKSKLSDFMHVVLLNEQQQQQKQIITNDDDFDVEKYKIFINNF